MPCDENRHKWAPHIHISIILPGFATMVFREYQSPASKLAAKASGKSYLPPQSMRLPTHAGPLTDPSTQGMWGTESKSILKFYSCDLPTITFPPSTSAEILNGN